MSLEFLHSSSRSRLNLGWIGDCEAKRGEHVRLLRHFLAQQCDEIQAGRASCVTAPLWQCCIRGATFRAEGLQRGQEQGAVCGDGKDRLLGHGSRVPQLRLADAQRILLFAVVHLSGKGLARCTVSRPVSSPSP